MWAAMFYSGFSVSNDILILWTPAYFQISLHDDRGDKTGKKTMFLSEIHHEIKIYVGRNALALGTYGIDFKGIVC